MRLLFVFVVVACVACSETKPQAPRAPEKWEALTAAKCVELCAPLEVAHFTPQCGRKVGSNYYYCSGEYSSMDEVCACGKTRVQAAPQAPQVDTTTPVLLHHGLKAVLKH